MKNPHLSKPQIVRIAACHTCAARPGQPCIFTAEEDPQNLRAAAGQCHADRIMRARRIAVQHDAAIKELVLAL